MRLNQSVECFSGLCLGQQHVSLQFVDRSFECSDSFGCWLRCLIFLGFDGLGIIPFESGLRNRIVCCKFRLLFQDCQPAIKDRELDASISTKISSAEMAEVLDLLNFISSRTKDLRLSISD